MEIMFNAYKRTNTDDNERRLMKHPVLFPVGFDILTYTTTDL